MCGHSHDYMFVMRKEYNILIYSDNEGLLSHVQTTHYKSCIKCLSIFLAQARSCLVFKRHSFHMHSIKCDSSKLKSL